MPDRAAAVVCTLQHTRYPKTRTATGTEPPLLHGDKGRDDGAGDDGAVQAEVRHHCILQHHAGIDRIPRRALAKSARLIGLSRKWREKAGAGAGAGEEEGGAADWERKRGREEASFWARGWVPRRLWRRLKMPPPPRMLDE